jgi:hypothetical protein
MPKQGREARISQHDREIAAIRKLILTGMKMINANAKGIRELQAAQKKTDAAQHKTEETLERFIRSLGRGHGNGNGHRKGRRIQ